MSDDAEDSRARAGALGGGGDARAGRGAAVPEVHREVEAHAAEPRAGHVRCQRGEQDLRVRGTLRHRIRRGLRAGLLFHRNFCRSREFYVKSDRGGHHVFSHAHYRGCFVHYLRGKAADKKGARGERADDSEQNFFDQESCAPAQEGFPCEKGRLACKFCGVQV